MTIEEQRVLAYLKEFEQVVGDCFKRLSIYGMKATELVRLLEDPEHYGNKPFVHVCALYKAISKIDRRLDLHVRDIRGILTKGERKTE